MTPIRILARQPTVQDVPVQSAIPSTTLSTKYTVYIHNDHLVEITPDLYILFLLISEKEPAGGDREKYFRACHPFAREHRSGQMLDVAIEYFRIFVFLYFCVFSISWKILHNTWLLSLFNQISALKTNAGFFRP